MCWEGELGHLQRHLYPGKGVGSSKGCGYIMVECSYQRGVQLQRRLIREHEMEIEIQVACLAQRFEANFKRVTIENKQLRQELNNMKEAHERDSES